MDIADKQKENIGAGQTLFRKSVSELDANKKGYADANYTLTVTAEFVQATTDAVKASWCGSDDKAEAKYNAIMAKLTNVAESTSDPHLTNK